MKERKRMNICGVNCKAKDLTIEKMITNDGIIKFRGRHDDRISDEARTQSQFLVVLLQFWGH